MLTLRGLDVVLGDLATLGYDARWGVVSAENAGAPHIRERIWILAYTHSERCKSVAEEWGGNGEVLWRGLSAKGHVPICKDLWDLSVLPLLGLDDGVAPLLDGIRAAGEGQVPAVARLAWEILST
jgi:DNA (cytosine-5)-methyltransferase 1